MERWQKDQQMNTNDVKIKPREGLREPNFRKYEDYIARACKGSVVISPVGMKASTFVVMVREAIRGFKLYNYYSNKIPVNYELRRLQVFETEDDKVLIKNEHEDKLGMKQFNEKLEDYPATIVDGKVVGVPGRFTKPTEFVFIDYNSPEEFDKLIKQVQGKELDTITKFFLVRTKNEQEMQEIRSKIESYPRKHIPEVSLVYTGSGHWHIE